MKEWIKKTFSEKDGTPSSKRQLMAFSVLLTSGIVVASFVLDRAVPESAKELLQVLLYASGFNYTVSRFFEKPKEENTNG